MSTDHSEINTNPETRVDFETSITALIEVAHANGVDVENGIDLYHPPREMPSWTVEITEVNNAE